MRQSFNCLLLLILLAVSVGAQTGPGGVGGSATNVLWLSADNGVFNGAGNPATNGNDVQTWSDRSGNGRDATQATAGLRPNYTTNALNSLPVLAFTAANSDQLMATSVSTANTASAWAVASYGSLPSSNPGILVASPSGAGANAAPGDKSIGMWVSSGTAQAWGRGIQSDNTSRDISQVTTLSANTFYIINNIYRSSGINQFVNSTASGNNAGHNGTLRSWRDVSIGRQGTESWNGNIAEIIFFNFEVNSAQRIIIDNYLAAKYGLTLTSNDLYDEDNGANGNYDFEVAGIGRVDAANIHADAQGTGIVRILNPTNLDNNEFLMWGHDNLSTQATNTTDVPTGVQARMARRWRVSEASTAGTAVNVGNVDIRFDLAGLGSVTASDLRLLIDTDNDNSFADETPIAGATLFGGTVYQFAGVSAISNNVRFSLGTISKNQTPLPVELVSFSVAETEEGSASIKWTTATEKNNERFEVLRSRDGEAWETIHICPGRGNGQMFQHYEVIDPYPYRGTSYYRLNQVDVDGSSKLYPTEVLTLSGGEEPFRVFPNPVEDELVLQGEHADLEEVQLFDQFGKALDPPVRRESSNRLVMDLTVLPVGIYFLKTKTMKVKVVKL